MVGSWWIFVYGVVLVLCAHGQVYSQVDDDVIPVFDQGLIYGKLKNGFKYHIIERPSSKSVLIKFVVKVGSNQEEFSQIQLSHLLEHMPFVATRHFSNAMNYFAARGLIRGLDINASTANDRTSYYLNIPADSTELISKALLFLRDCAHDITLDSLRANTERQVVLSELRRARSYASEMERVYLKDILPSKRFARKSNMDPRINLVNFRLGDLTRFYEDWYHPGLEAIFITGNVDGKRLESEVVRLFSDLQNPPKLRDYLFFEKGDTIRANNKRCVIVKHKEMPEVELQIHMKGGYQKIKTYGDLKRNVIYHLYDEMARRRFEKISEQVGASRLGSTYNAHSLSIGPDFSDLVTIVRCSGEKISNVFSATMYELNRIKLLGFSRSEIQYAKDEYLRRELDSQNLHSLLEGYVDFFVKGEGGFNQDSIRQITRRQLLSVTDSAINQTVKSLFDMVNPEFVLLLPEEMSENMPKNVLEMWDEALEKDIVPFEMGEQIDISALFTSVEDGEGQYRRDDFPLLGITRVILGNGVHVVLKQLEAGQFMQDGFFMIHGFRRGGTNRYAAGDYYSAAVSPSLVHESAFLNLNGFQIDKILGEKGMSVNQYVDDVESGIWGTFSSKQFNLGFGVFCNYLLNPQVDSTVLSAWKTSVMTNIARTGDQRSLSFMEKINFYMYGDDSRRRSDVQAETIDKIYPDRALSIYKERICNADNAVYEIVGDFDTDTLIPSLVKCLGSLPVVKESSGVDKPQNKSILHDAAVQQIIVDDNLDKSRVQFIIPGEFDYTFSNRVKMDFFKVLLQDRLLLLLRNTLGAVYTVNVSIQRSPYSSQFSFIISYDCEPVRANDVVRLTVLELLKFADNEFLAEWLLPTRNLLRNKLHDDLKTPDFWFHYLQDQIVNDDPLDEVRNLETILSEITLRKLHRDSKKIFRKENIHTFLMIPSGV